MKKKTLAIDLAIIPPEPLSQLAVALSKKIAEKYPDSFELKNDRLPHISVAMAYIKEDDVPRLIKSLNGILKPQVQLAVQVPGSIVHSGSGLSCHLVIEKTPEMQSLHKKVMEIFKPFETENQSGEDAFILEPDEHPIEKILNWPRFYRKNHSSSASYDPHITLGRGEPVTDKTISKIFESDRIVLAQMGDYCTCRKILHEWKLT